MKALVREQVTFSCAQGDGEVCGSADERSAQMTLPCDVKAGAKRALSHQGEVEGYRACRRHAHKECDYILLYLAYLAVHAIIR
jgi:hypothetical protein